MDVPLGNERAAIKYANAIHDLRAQNEKTKNFLNKSKPSSGLKSTKQSKDRNQVQLGTQSGRIWAVHCNGDVLLS